MSFVVQKILDSISANIDYDMADRFTIHPSSLTACPRSQVIRAAGIRPYTTIENELMFCVANGTHNMLEMLMGQAIDGLHCDSECRLTLPEYMMAGTADIVISGPLLEEWETNIRCNNVERAVVDIKTKAFVNKCTKVTDGHIYQVQMYMHMAFAQFATLLYVSRVNGDYALYDVGYNDGMVDNILSSVDQLFDTLDEGRLPDPDRDCNKCWFMKYCESKFYDKMEEVVLESYETSKTEEFKTRRG